MKPLAALVLALLFVGAPLAGGAADPYEIDAIISLTGQLAFIGQSQQQALHVIEDQVNKTGGIRGRPLHIAISDDESNPQVGVQLANGAIAKGVHVVLGPSLTAVCSAVLPLMEHGPFDFCFSPGIHPTSGFVFSGEVSTGDLVAAGIRYFRLKGWTRLAVIIATDASGQDVERGIRAALARPENSTVSVVAFEHFNPTDVSVGAQMARIKAANPQVLITWGTGTPEGTLLRGVSDAALNVPVFTSAANLTYAQMKTYTGFLPNQLLFPGFPFLAPESITNPAVKRAVAAFLGGFTSAGIKPDNGQAIGWDPTWIVVDALRKLGPDASADQIRDYIAKLRGWNGIIGTYDFPKTPQRGIDIDAVVIVRWDAAKGTWVGISKPGGTAAITLHAWGAFYGLTGAAAATLIGLIFIAISLRAGQYTDEYRMGTGAHYFAVLHSRQARAHQLDRAPPVRPAFEFGLLASWPFSPPSTPVGCWCTFPRWTSPMAKTSAGTRRTPDRALRPAGPIPSAPRPRHCYSSRFATFGTSWSGRCQSSTVDSRGEEELKRSSFCGCPQ